MIHFGEDLGGLDGGGHADAVVESFGHEQIGVSHGGESGERGDGGTELDAIIVDHFATGVCADVDIHRFDWDGGVALGGR